MKLLIVAQTLDQTDPVLGFFHRWVEELAKRCDKVVVVCLKNGTTSLQKNVRVYSLGKEHGRVSRLCYSWRFLRYAWGLRGEYDTVFVHMNEEYVLIAGWLWKLLRKKTFLWRNHYTGSWRTDLAAAYCEKVFCTSTQSYTAKYAKTVIMPVGIDTNLFRPDLMVERVKGSVLFLGRLDTSKHAEVFIRALGILAKKSIPFAATIVGSQSDLLSKYTDELKELARQEEVSNRVKFVPSVTNTEAVRYFNNHELYVNCSTSGMLDKTIFEAGSCETPVLSASPDMAEQFDKALVFKPSSHESLADLMQLMLLRTDVERSEIGKRLRQFVIKRHSLALLVDMLSIHINPAP